MHLSQQSKLSSIVRCPVCGQGFLIFSGDGVQAAHDVNRRLIQHALRAHHSTRTGAKAHPASTFHIPSWSGAQSFLASASLSNLLDNAI
ncbi:MAG: hypothetical protein WDN23_22565 [Edaphobacter sp.]